MVPGADPSDSWAAGSAAPGEVETLRRQLAAARASAERYRALAEGLGEGIAIADLAERFTYANAAADALFGLPPGGLTGRSLREFTAGPQFDLVAAQTRLRRQGHQSTYELSISRADGARRRVLVTCVPQTGEDGQFQGSLGVFRDITARQQAEEAQRLDLAVERVRSAAMAMRDADDWGAVGQQLWLEMQRVVPLSQCRIALAGHGTRPPVQLRVTAAAVGPSVAWCGQPEMAIPEGALAAPFVGGCLYAIPAGEPASDAAAAVARFADVLALARQRADDLRALGQRTSELGAAVAAWRRAEARLAQDLAREEAMGRIRDQIIGLNGMDDFARFLAGAWTEELRGVGVPVHRITVQVPGATAATFRVHGLDTGSLLLPGVDELPHGASPWVGAAWRSGRQVVVPRAEMAALAFVEDPVIWLVETPFPGHPGSLGVSTGVADGFSDDQLRTLQTFAGLVATALQRLDDVAALRASESKYRRLTDNSHDIIYTLDLKAEFTFVSPACQLLLGFPVAHYEGARLRDFVHADDVDACLARVAEVLRTGGRQVAVEYRMQHADGGWRWHSSSMAALVDDAGLPVGVEGISRDITERRRAGMAARVALALQRLRNLVLQMQADGDWQGLVDALRRELRALVPFDTCQVNLLDPAATGQRDVVTIAHNAYHADYGSQWRPALRLAIETGQPVYRPNRRHPLFSPGMPPHIHSVVDVPFRSGTLAVNSPVEGAFSADDLAILGEFAEVLSEAWRRVEDLAEARRLAAEVDSQRNRALEVNRLQALGEMAAGVAHELNQPLNGIRAYAEGTLYGLRQGWDVGAAETMEALHDIVKQVDRMVVIIDHMRQFSRDTSHLEPVACAPTEVLDGALKLIGAQLRVRGVRLELDVASGLPPVLGQPNQLEQVVLNLLANARDALETRAAAEAGDSQWQPALILGACVEGAGRWVCLSVRDNGGGIDPEVLPRVFEPFFTTKAVGRGTGLGLSISRAIVQEHGGVLEVDNHPGEGVAFRALLPVGAADPA
jgi:PAS domain S-box-containing protein